MNKFLLLLLSALFVSNSVYAAGCLKGAAVGAVAGHVAGHHAVIGAVGGCVAGKHHANKKAKEEKENVQKEQIAPTK